MPNPNSVPPETAWDVLFAVVGGIAGLVATHMASRFVRHARKTATSKWLLVSGLFLLSFTLVFAVVYRVFVGFETPIPALPISVMVGSLLMLCLMLPLIGIHTFLRKLTQKNPDHEA